MVLCLAHPAKKLTLIFRERKEGGERERHTSICCSTFLCIYYLLPVCLLTGDRTRYILKAQQAELPEELDVEERGTGIKQELGRFSAGEYSAVICQKGEEGKRFGGRKQRSKSRVCF